MSAYATSLLESSKEAVVAECLGWHDRALNAEAELALAMDKLTVIKINQCTLKDCSWVNRVHKLESALAERERECERLRVFVTDVANWREWCHEYDEDMDNPARDFDDEEEWARIEEHANGVLEETKRAKS